MMNLACSSCPTCPATCKQCSSSSKCTKCKSPYLLYQSECLGSCPDATFISTDTCIGNFFSEIESNYFSKTVHLVVLLAPLKSLAKIVIRGIYCPILSVFYLFHLPLLLLKRHKKRPRKQFHLVPKGLAVLYVPEVRHFLSQHWSQKLSKTHDILIYL